MTNRNRILIAASVIALIIAGAIFAHQGRASAQERQRGMHKGRHGGDMGRMFGRIARDLDLTDDQKAKIKEILEAERATVAPLFQQLRANRKELRATKDGQSDEAQVNALKEKQSQIMSELRVEKERIKGKVFAILTPEQQTKAQEMLEQFEQRGRKRFGKSKSAS